jgi:hypothetical protein
MPTLSELTKMVDKLKDEQRYEAQSDAYAIAQVAEVKLDKRRLERAKLVADHMAAAAAEKANAVASAAK